MGLIFLWVFKLRVDYCTQTVMLLPYTPAEKFEICLERVLKEERKKNE